MHTTASLQDIRRSVVVSIAINHLWSRGAGRRAACARASPASNDPTRTLRAARDARHGRPSPAKAISPRARALAFWQPGGLQRRWGHARSRPPRRWRQRRCCGVQCRDSCYPPPTTLRACRGAVKARGGGAECATDLMRPFGDRRRVQGGCMVALARSSWTGSAPMAPRRPLERVSLTPLGAREDVGMESPN